MQIALSGFFGDADTALRLVAELQALPPCLAAWGCYVSPAASATALRNYRSSVVAHLQHERLPQRARTTGVLRSKKSRIVRLGFGTS